MGHWHELQKELAAPGRELRKMIPHVYEGFNGLHNAAMDEGESLPRTTKELIALSVSIAQQCDGCIAAHARALARFEADPNEVAEGIGVAIMMMGGPGITYGAKAWDAFSEFRQLLEDRKTANG